MHIVFDFDGVIRDPTTNDPMEGAMKGLLKCSQGNKITILTANDTSFVQSWLFEHMKKIVRLGIINSITNKKPVGDLYIDDKGYRFTDWASFLTSVQTKS